MYTLNPSPTPNPKLGSRLSGHLLAQVAARREEVGEQAHHALRARLREARTIDAAQPREEHRAGVRWCERLVRVGVRVRVRLTPTLTTITTSTPTPTPTPNPTPTPTPNPNPNPNPLASQRAAELARPRRVRGEPERH